MINENVIRLLRIFFSEYKEEEQERKKNNKCQISSILMKIYFVNNKM
jgi:hypothetical protein